MESQLLEEKVIRKRLSEALISLGMNNNQIARKTDLDRTLIGLSSIL